MAKTLVVAALVLMVVVVSGGSPKYRLFESTGFLAPHPAFAASERSQSLGGRQQRLEGPKDRRCDRLRRGSLLVREPER